MFRALLILLALVVAAFSWTIFKYAGSGFGWALALLNIGILIACILLERARYKPLLERPPGAGWTDTGERSIDTRTGRVISVYYQASTGERQYVAGARTKPQ